MNLWAGLINVAAAYMKKLSISLRGGVVQETPYMDPKITIFLEKIRPGAKAIEAVALVPWRFATAQAAHESNWGLSTLTVQANNLFGITGESWALRGKPTYWAETKEYDKRLQPYMIRRPFRKYASWSESLEDWLELLERIYPRALAAARANYFSGFAHELQEGGYATDPHYAIRLCSVYSDIEDLS